MLFVCLKLSSLICLINLDACGNAFILDVNAEAKSLRWHLCAGSVTNILFL